MANDRKTEADSLDNAIADIELQLANKAKYEDEAKKIQNQITQVEQRKKAEETVISTLRRQKESLEVKKEQLSNTEVHLDETKKELEHWQAKSKEQQARIAEYKQVLAERAAIEKGYSDFMETKRLNDEFNQKLGQLFVLRERISNLDKVIRQAAEALTIEHKLIQAKLAENEAKFARATQLEEALTQARKRLLELTKLEETVTKKENKPSRLPPKSAIWNLLRHDWTKRLQI